MVEEKEQKTCLVVCPIGPRGSPARDRMDGVFNEVIAPIAKEFGYRAEIAIHSKRPGIVTEGIVTKLIEVDLVIVDLHGQDGNVMYEMALRHATGGPIVQMIPEGEEAPFDIAGSNTVIYDFSVHQLNKWRQDLRTALQAVAEGRVGSNPVSRASMVRGLQAVARTSMFTGLQAQVGGSVAPVEPPPPQLEDSPPQLESASPQVVRLRGDVERDAIRPGLLWNSSMTRSDWMNDLHQALATHSRADLLDTVRVDLKEVDGDLVLVTVQKVDSAEHSATKMISKYKIKAFKENATDAANRIWSRVDLDIRRVGEVKTGR